MYKLIINRYILYPEYIKYNVKLLLNENITLNNGKVTNYLFEDNFSEFYNISKVLDYLYVNSVDNKFCLLNYKHNIIKDIVGEIYVIHRLLIIGNGELKT